MSIAVSGWVGAGMLWLIALRRGLLSARSVSWRRLALIALAALLMGFAVRAIASSVAACTRSIAIGRLAGAGLLCVVIAFGIAFYLSCLWLFGVLRPRLPKPDPCRDAN